MADADRALLEFAYRRLEYLTGQLAAAIDGIPDDDFINWRPAASHEGGGEMNTFSALLAHIHGAGYWRMRNQLYSIPYARDRDAEFTTSLPAAELMERMHTWLTEFRQLLDTEPTPDLSSLPITIEDSRSDWTRRDFALNMVEHTALHVGHAQIHRQLWLSERAERA